MLSHKYCFKCIGQCSRNPFEAGKAALSFLPICHIFERMILYLYQYYGVSIYFGESIDKLVTKERSSTVISCSKTLEKYTIKFTPKELS
jgi:long-chain acyl-CoA synthetase